jgi:hypothetical protein
MTNRKRPNEKRNERHRFPVLRWFGLRSPSKIGRFFNFFFLLFGFAPYRRSPPNRSLSHCLFLPRVSLARWIAFRDEFVELFGGVREAQAEEGAVLWILEIIWIVAKTRYNSTKHFESTNFPETLLRAEIALISLLVM